MSAVSVAQINISVHLNLRRDLLRNLICVHIRLQSPSYKRTGRRRNISKCPLLPPPGESCPQALPQAAAGSVFLNSKQYISLQTPPQTLQHAQAFGSNWEVTLARRSFTISSQQGRVSPNLSVYLSATRSHPDSKPYMGKLPEK